MDAQYHRQVLLRAIGGRISPRAHAAVLAANLDQDSIRGLLSFERHFDNCLFAEGLAYIETCRTKAAQAATPAGAWDAFGRLAHTAQDFYSHSNYVALWLQQFQPGSAPPPDQIDGLDSRLLRHPALISGRVYLPLEALTFFPRITPLVRRGLPRDSHAWMNLDNPARGPLFPYSLVAAEQRTLFEFERTLAAIGEGRGEAAMHAFMDR
ncbi:MAG: hypothetical protein ABI847_04795 [Anaerolineales bacterium]